MMGLLDILNGMQNGPRGQQNPNAGSSGMSPITMAILGLLAYKAVKGFSGQSSSSPSTPGNALPGGLSNIGSGGLGGLLPGGLGGLLAGGAAGGILSGGLNDLLSQFNQNGLGNVAKSWIGTGANIAVSPQELEKALGSDKINVMMEHSGMSRAELLDGLSQNLPEVVDKLTPEGRVPSATEIS
jgi:uncharacterized protein YidB (DUF937 family)